MNAPTGSLRRAATAPSRGRHERVQAEVAGESCPVGRVVALQLVDPAVERGVGQVVVVGRLQENGDTGLSKTV